MADCKHRVMDNCKKDNRPCIYAKECFDPKPMTNGDRFRSISDDTFATWLGGHLDCEVCPARADCANGLNCIDALNNWLKQPRRTDDV